MLRSFERAGDADFAEIAPVGLAGLVLSLKVYTQQRLTGGAAVLTLDATHGLRFTLLAFELLGLAVGIRPRVFRLSHS